MTRTFQVVLEDGEDPVAVTFKYDSGRHARGGEPIGLAPGEWTACRGERVGDTDEGYSRVRRRGKLWTRVPAMSDVAQLLARVEREEKRKETHPAALTPARPKVTE